MSRKALHHTPENDGICHPENISSSTDCTGLMPSMVYTDEEAENLSRLEGIHPIKPQNKQKD